MKRSYHTINKQGKANEKKLAEFLSKGGQLLLPMVDLIEQCQMACDELKLVVIYIDGMVFGDHVTCERPGGWMPRAA